MAELDYSKLYEARNKYLRSIQNLPVLDAFRNELSWGGLVKNFYVNQNYYLRKSGKKVYGIGSLAELYEDKCIVISGPSGYGKTSSLKKLFITSDADKQIFHYVSASIFLDRKNRLSLYEKIIRTSIEENKRIDGTILVDGIEEAFGNSYENASEFIKNLSETNNHFWISSRPNYLERLDSSIDQCFEDVAEIEVWGKEDFDDFLNNYAEKTGKMITNKVNKLLKNAKIDTSSIYCPLYATILVFLINYQDSESEQIVIRDEYDVLKVFVSLWFEREKEKYDIQGSEEFYREKLCRIAIELYKHGRPSLQPEFSAIEGLLNIPRKYKSKDSAIHGFYHRDFLIYFVVEGMRNAAINHPEDITQWFTKTFSDEVSNLYKKALRHDEAETQKKIYNHLFSAYRKTYEEHEKVRSELQAIGLEADALGFLELRDELLYYILRIRKTDCKSFIEYAHDHQGNETMLALGLAYGMAGICQHEYTFDFAQKLIPKSKEDLINRSWAVCFFGDRNENGFSYKDTNRCKWEKTRNAKLARIKRTDEVAFRYRLLDLPLLYCFYASRDFEDCISYGDYETLHNCDISYLKYTDKERSFLEHQKHQLLQKYSEKMWEKGINEHVEAIVPLISDHFSEDGKNLIVTLDMETKERIFQYLKAEEDTDRNLRDFWKKKGNLIINQYKEMKDVPLGNMLPKQRLNKKLQSCEILLITANSVEGAVVSRKLMEMNHTERLERISEDKIIYQFSKIGNKSVVHIWPQKTSSFTEHGSFNALRAALKRFHPQYVFSVGIGFGSDPVEQTLGDVLIADHLVFYDSFNKVNQGMITLSPDEVQIIGEDVFNGLPALSDPAGPQKNLNSGFKWYKGALLTGGTVLSDSVEKLRLLKAADKMSYHVVGGEMEGSGLFFACNIDEPRIPFTIVKGICDWAINKNGWSFASNDELNQNDIKDCVQAFACDNAFITLCFMLDQISL